MTEIFFLVAGAVPLIAAILLLWFGPMRSRSYRDPGEQ